MNFFEIIQDVCVETGFPSPDTWSDVVELHHQKIKKNINNILKMICASRVDQWKFLEETYNYTTVSGTHYLNLPDYIGTIRNVEIMVTNEYEPLNWCKNVELVTSNTLLGRPTTYTEYQRKLYFYHIPNDTYSVKVHYYSDYFAREDDDDTIGKEKLLVATDIPKIPDKYHEILVFGASMLYIGKVDDPQYQHYRQMYDDTHINLRGEWKRSKEDFNSLKIGSKTRTYRDDMRDFFSKRW